MGFEENAVSIAKNYCIENNLFPTSIEILNPKTIQFQFEEMWNNDWILKILTNLFEGLGGVDVDWDIFDELVTIF